MREDDADVDPDFVMYVAGQQRQLLRAARLTAGDLPTATRALQRALTDLAHGWGRRHEEDVATIVRAALYGPLVKEAERAEAREEVARPDPDAFLSETPAEDDDGPDTWAALATLTPRERAALVLRHFEHRGEQSVSAVLGGAVGAVPDRVPAELAGYDLTVLLERASEEVPEPDEGPSAWRRAGRERRGRRRRGGLVALGVAAVVGVVVAVSTGGGAPPDTTETRPVAVTARGTTTDGVPYLMAPLPGTEVVRPTVRSSLPAYLDLRGETAPLSLRGTDDPVVAAAAFLRDVGDREYRPVVLTLGGALVEVDTLTLGPAVDLDGNQVSPLATSGVSLDGTRIAFAQPDGRVVLADLVDHATQEFRLDADGIDDVGWSGDGRGLVASNDRASWFVDLRSSTVRRLPTRAGPGHYRIVADLQGQRPMALQTYDVLGRRSADPIALGYTFRQVRGDTVSGPEGRAATAVFVVPETFGPDAEKSLVRDAIYAVDADEPTARAVLAFPEGGGERRFVGCCTPLAWIGPTRLLFSSGHSAGTWIMLWDTDAGTVDAVTEVRGAGGMTYPGLALGVVG